MTAKKTIVRGDLRSIKDEIAGPVKVFLPSNETDENGELLMEPYVNGQGKQDERPKRDEEPFLSAVYFRTNFRTPKSQEKMRLAGIEYEQDPLKAALVTIETMVSKWDLKDGGVPVKLDFDSLLEADLPDSIIYGVLNACLEYNRPPKELSEKSPSTS